MKRLLHNLKIDESQLCGLCSLHIEIVYLLNIYCRKSIFLVTDLTNWIKTKTNKTLLLDNIK